MQNSSRKERGMFLKIKCGSQILRIPFSSRMIATRFARGFNETRRLKLQNKEYPCANPDEQRGARFAEIVIRYCETQNLRLDNDDIEVRDDKESQQSLFDGFE
jgi:hypothetical protein